jgi:hypothetical protein
LFSCDEAGDVYEETVADWTAKLSSVIEGYNPKDYCKW